MEMRESIKKSLNIPKLNQFDGSYSQKFNVEAFDASLSESKERSAKIRIKRLKNFDQVHKANSVC